MNIFFLHSHPSIAAQYMCDKHVVKMVVETAQLLCTAHHVMGSPLPDLSVLYKPTHVNHPCAIWTRETTGNYLWLYYHFCALLEEYTYRYEKSHKTGRLVQPLSFFPYIQKTGSTEQPLCMPDDCKTKGDVVKSYRQYYMQHKAYMAEWNKKRQPPDWWPYKWDAVCAGTGKGLIIQGYGKNIGKSKYGNTFKYTSD